MQFRWHILLEFLLPRLLHPRPLPPLHTHLLQPLSILQTLPLPARLRGRLRPALHRRPHHFLRIRACHEQGRSYLLQLRWFGVEGLGLSCVLLVYSHLLRDQILIKRLQLRLLVVKVCRNRMHRRERLVLRILRRLCLRLVHDAELLRIKVLHMLCRLHHPLRFFPDLILLNLLYLFLILGIRYIIPLLLQLDLMPALLRLFINMNLLG